MISGISEKEILNVADVAELLQCSKLHARKLLNGRVAGLPGIPHVPAGRLLLVRRTVLMRWIQERESVRQ
jgi:Helix-turn-helix domain